MKKVMLCLGCMLFLAACMEGDARLLSDKKTAAAPAMDTARFQAKAAEAGKYCRVNRMNTEVCLLADMGLHSGLQRLVAWDMKRNTILFTGLVSHGCGREPWGKDHSREQPVFSNKADSHCSALGKYAVGARGYSQWGIHVKYLLHGKEAGNNNALKREIVLHGWDAIADQEVYPEGTPEGWGCPAVSNHVMRQLDTLLRNRNKEVLLWIYQ